MVLVITRKFNIIYYKVEVLKYCFVTIKIIIDAMSC